MGASEALSLPEETSAGFACLHLDSLSYSSSRSRCCPWAAVLRSFLRLVDFKSYDWATRGMLENCQVSAGDFRLTWCWILKPDSSFRGVSCKDHLCQCEAPPHHDGTAAMLHSRDGVSTTFIFIKDIKNLFLMLSNTCIMIPDSFFVFDHIKNTSVRLTRVVLLHFLEKTGLFSDIQQQIHRGASLVSHKSVLSWFRTTRSQSP